MILGSKDWSEVEIEDPPTVTPEVSRGNVVVHTIWPIIGKLRERQPTWFTPVWPEMQEIFFLRIDRYRAAKQYAAKPNWAEMEIDEFVERWVSGVA